MALLLDETEDSSHEEHFSSVEQQQQQQQQFDLVEELLKEDPDLFSGVAPLASSPPPPECSELITVKLEQQPFIPPPRIKHKPTGRKAIPAEYIASAKVRSVTFSKRKTGIMNKAFQIVHMTGCNAFVLIQQVPSVQKVEGIDDVCCSYSIPVKNKGRNTYAYACDTWRSLFSSEEITELLSKRFDPDSMMDTSIPYTSSSHEKVKMVPLKDKLSNHSDLYCNISLGRRKKKGDNDFIYLEDAPEDEKEESESESSDDDDTSTESLDQDSSSSRPKKKARKNKKKKKENKKRTPRGVVVVKIIDDKKKRGTCFCKRKFGLVSKAFELVGKTGCRCLLILSYPEQEGGSDTYHIYASPDWRKMALSEKMIRMFRNAQHQLERPDPLLEIAAEKAIDYYSYYLPAIAYNFKINTHVIEEKGEETTTVQDAFISFVWRESTIPPPKNPTRLKLNRERKAARDEEKKRKMMIIGDEDPSLLLHNYEEIQRFLEQELEDFCNRQQQFNAFSELHTPLLIDQQLPPPDLLHRKKRLLSFDSESDDEIEEQEQEEENVIISEEIEEEGQIYTLEHETTITTTTTRVEEKMVQTLMTTTKRETTSSSSLKKKKTSALLFV